MYPIVLIGNNLQPSPRPSQVGLSRFKLHSHHLHLNFRYSLNVHTPTFPFKKSTNNLNHVLARSLSGSSNNVATASHHTRP